MMMGSFILAKCLLAWAVVLFCLHSNVRFHILTAWLSITHALFVCLQGRGDLLSHLKLLCCCCHLVKRKTLYLKFGEEKQTLSCIFFDF